MFAYNGVSDAVQNKLNTPDEFQSASNTAATDAPYDTVMTNIYEEMNPIQDAANELENIKQRTADLERQLPIQQIDPNQLNMPIDTNLQQQVPQNQEMVPNQNVVEPEQLPPGNSNPEVDPNAPQPTYPQDSEQVITPIYQEPEPQMDPNQQQNVEQVPQEQYQEPQQDPNQVQPQDSDQVIPPIDQEPQQPEMDPNQQGQESEGEQPSQEGEEEQDPNAMDPNQMDDGMGGEGGDPNSMDPNMGMGMDPNAPPKPTDSEEVGRIYELKAIYSRLISVESYLSSTFDPELLGVRNLVGEAVTIFQIMMANYSLYKDNIDEKIISYYRFIEKVYMALQKHYKNSSEYSG